MELVQLDTLGKQLSGVVKHRYGLDDMSFTLVINVVNGETLGAFGVLQKGDTQRDYALSCQEVKWLLLTPPSQAKLQLETLLERHALLLLNHRNNGRDEQEGEG